MKIRFEKPHLLNGEWVQPILPDGSGGYGDVDVSDEVIASFVNSGVKFTRVIETLKTEIVTQKKPRFVAKTASPDETV